MKVSTCNVPIFEFRLEGRRQKKDFEGIKVWCSNFQGLPRRQKVERGHLKVSIGGFSISEFCPEVGRRKSPFSAEMTIFGCRVVLSMAK